MAFDLTDEQLRTLLSIEKRLTSTASPKLKVKGKHQERSYALEAVDGQTFRVYARQSTVLQDAFSCGLLWITPTGEEVVLMRVNGASHSHRNRLENTDIVGACHIHIATARYFAAGLNGEGFAEESGEYTDLEGAMRVLGHRCKIVDEPFSDSQGWMF